MKRGFSLNNRVFSVHIVCGEDKESLTLMKFKNDNDFNFWVLCIVLSECPILKENISVLK